MNEKPFEAMHPDERVTYLLRLLGEVVDVLDSPQVRAVVAEHIAQHGSVGGPSFDMIQLRKLTRRLWPKDAA